MYNENSSSSGKEKDYRREQVEANVAEVVATLIIEGLHPTPGEIEDLKLIGLGLMTEQEFVEKHINSELAQYGHKVTL